MIFALCVAVTTFALTVPGQSLPKEIRGYRVYEANISVSNAAELRDQDENKDVTVKLGTPRIADVSLTGITLEVGAEIVATDRSGSIDFLTFREFTVNGIPVDIEEYWNAFTFQKNMLYSLPKPVRIGISGRSAAMTAYKELIESRKEWSVTGTILVFGKFRRMGLSFKRVVPVRIALSIPNPIRSITK